MRVLPLARVGLLLGTAGLVLLSRFRWFDAESSGTFQKYLGYYWLLALLVLAALFLGRAAVEFGWFSLARWRRHLPALIAIVAVGVFLHLHEPHVMRVFFDEPSHVACSLGMHLDRIAVLPINSNYVGDLFVLGADSASYRQYLYPLLISLLHDLTGYRVANAFVVNALLTPLLLAAAYFAGVRVSGRVAGFVAIGLLGSLPLLAQNVCSAGYDVLTTTLLGGLLVFTIEYARAPLAERARHMDLSLAVALLLAVSRNEAVLYLVPWILVTGLLWWRDRRITVTWFAALSPLFLLPNLLSSLRMMSDSATLYTDMRSQGEAFFSLSYLETHVPQALYYFFGLARNASNSLLLSLLGAFGFVGLLVTRAGEWRRGQARAEHTVLAVFALAVLATYLFVLTMFWSDPNDPNVARLSLGVQFLGAVLGGWLIGQFGVLQRRPWLPLGVIALWTLLCSVPAMAHAFATYDLVPSRSGAWFMGDAQLRDRRQTMFIAASSTNLVIQRMACHNFKYLNSHPEVFVRALKAGLYREIFLHEDYLLDPVTGRWSGKKDCAAGAHLITEVVETRRFTPLYEARITRLLGFRTSDGREVTVASEDPVVSVQERFANEAECLRYRFSLYP